MTKPTLHNVTVEPPSDTVSEITAYVIKQATTLNAFLPAVFSALFHRYTGHDFCRPGFLCKNRRIFRYIEIDFSCNPSLNEIIEQIRFQAERFSPARQTIWKEFSAQDSLEFVLPAYFLRESVGIHSDHMSAEYYRDGLRLTCEQHPETGLKLTLSGNARLYPPELLEQIAGHTINLLTDMPAHPERRVSDAAMLSPEEIHRQTVGWNSLVAPYEERCIHRFFEDQAARTPDAAALRFEDKTLTYRELNVRANSLAHRLRKMGAKPETVVGVGMERSMQAAVCLLAILKSGAAYSIVYNPPPLMSLCTKNSGDFDSGSFG